MSIGNIIRIDVRRKSLRFGNTTSGFGGFGGATSSSGGLFGNTSTSGGLFGSKPLGFGGTSTNTSGTSLFGGNTGNNCYIYHEKDFVLIQYTTLKGKKSQNIRNLVLIFS